MPPSGKIFSFQVLNGLDQSSLIKDLPELRLDFVANTMDIIDNLFEIKEICTDAGTRANLVAVENDRNGQAYLGFCKALQPLMDGNVQELAGGEMLVLPGANLGIIYRNGIPVTAV